MTIHELKAWPDVFEAVWRGDKVHEYRRDDRPDGYDAGDLLHLREWIPDLEVGDRYTGREITAIVTHIDRGPEWGIPAGYANMSIRIITRKAAA